MLHAFIAMALAAAPAATEEPQWPEGSAMHTGQLEVARREAALKTLGVYEGRLDAMLSGTASSKVSFDERSLQALKSQRGAWRAYVDAECEMVGALSGGMSPWQSTRAVRCQANLAEQRVRRTASAVRCVSNIPPASRPFDAQRCLYQLAPLAVPLRP
jgi:uncharacterized protein YecT (DUF1311 family)